VFDIILRSPWSVPTVLPTSGYMRAKLAQEKAIASANVPYTILRATQFFEFAGAIANGGTNAETIRLTSALFQPIAADDVAAALAALAIEPAANRTFELAGPERIGLDDFVRRWLHARADKRSVVTDPQALYFGAAIDDRSLTPGDNPRLGTTRFDEWLARA